MIKTNEQMKNEKVAVRHCVKMWWDRAQTNLSVAYEQDRVPKESVWNPGVQLAQTKQERNSRDMTSRSTPIRHEQHIRSYTLT